MVLVVPIVMVPEGTSTVNLVPLDKRIVRERGVVDMVVCCYLLVASCNELLFDNTV